MNRKNTNRQNEYRMEKNDLKNMHALSNPKEELLLFPSNSKEQCLPYIMQILEMCSKGTPIPLKSPNNYDNVVFESM